MRSSAPLPFPPRPFSVRNPNRRCVPGGLRSGSAQDDHNVTTPNLFAILEELDISYEHYRHEAVFTCEQAMAAIPSTDAVQTKNIFLRDKRGRRHLLLVTTSEKAVDIKRFADQASADHLSFASAERL